MRPGPHRRRLRCRHSQRDGGRQQMPVLGLLEWRRLPARHRRVCDAVVPAPTLLVSLNRAREGEGVSHWVGTIDHSLRRSCGRLVYGTTTTPTAPAPYHEQWAAGANGRAAERLRLFPPAAERPLSPRLPSSELPAWGRSSDSACINAAGGYICTCDSHFVGDGMHLIPRPPATSPRPSFAALSP